MGSSSKTNNYIEITFGGLLRRIQDLGEDYLNFERGEGWEI